MKMIFLWIFSILLIGNSAASWSCDNDYGQECLPGLLTGSTVLLNDTDDRPRLPASDVTAIETDNAEGSCFFPYPFSSFDMYFCVQTSAGLRATCPTFNETGPLLNCSEGEYGYVEFNAGATDSRTYQLDLTTIINQGFHCLKFYYFFSDNVSDASIEVFNENSLTFANETIGTVNSTSPFDRWNEARFTFENNEPISNIFFSFSRNNVVIDPFYIAVDDFSISDQSCEPITVPLTSTLAPTTAEAVEDTSSSSSTVFVSTSSSSTTTIAAVSNDSTATISANTTTLNTTSVSRTASTASTTVPPVQTDPTTELTPTTSETSSATSNFSILRKDVITIFLLVLSFLIRY